jgi:hypothetical protein
MVADKKQGANVIKYSDLPGEVQYSVSVILAHRREIRRNLGAAIGWTAILPVGIATGSHTGKTSWSQLKTELFLPEELLLFAGGIGLAGYGLWKSHDWQFGKEYSWLFKTLGENKDGPKIRETLQKFDYFKVKNNGDLVGSNTAPVISKSFPVGRRRVVSPFAKPEIIERWKKGKIPKFVEITGPSIKLEDARKKHKVPKWRR